MPNVTRISSYLAAKNPVLSPFPAPGVIYFSHCLKYDTGNKQQTIPVPSSCEDKKNFSNLDTQIHTRLPILDMSPLCAPGETKQ